MKKREPKGNSMARMIKWASDADKAGAELIFPNRFENGRPLRAARHKNGVGRPPRVNIARGDAPLHNFGLF